jgi:hypothetical protein
VVSWPGMAMCVIANGGQQTQRKRKLEKELFFKANKRDLLEKHVFTSKNF